MINYSKTTHVNLKDLTEPDVTYAVSQVRENMTLSDFAAHISAHNSKYNKADILAVLTELSDCLVEQLLNGNKIQLGEDFGSFWLTLKSTGVTESVADSETGEKPVFTADDITGINVKWSKGKAFKSAKLMQTATFQEVETVAARNAALKLKKQQLAAGTYDPNGTSTSTSTGGSTQHE